MIKQLSRDGKTANIKEAPKMRGFEDKVKILRSITAFLNKPIYNNLNN